MQCLVWFFPNFICSMYFTSNYEWSTDFKKTTHFSIKIFLMTIHCTKYYIKIANTSFERSCFYVNNDTLVEQFEEITVHWKALKQGSVPTSIPEVSNDDFGHANHYSYNPMSWISHFCPIKYCVILLIQIIGLWE